MERLITILLLGYLGLGLAEAVVTLGDRSYYDHPYGRRDYFDRAPKYGPHYRDGYRGHNYHGNNYHGDSYHGDSYREGTTCSRRTPCYDVVLSFIIDGPVVKDETPGLIERWYRDAGFTRTEALKDLREGIEFFRRKYGVTFTGIKDEQLMDAAGNVVSDDGTAVFQPFPIGLEARYRLYTAAVGERSQVLNAPIKDLFFVVTVIKERGPAGEYNRTVPVGGTFLWGGYLIEQCPLFRHPRDCPTSSLLTPHNPHSSIFIRYTSKTYVLLNQPPSSYNFADCYISHPKFGEGTAIGFFPNREGSSVIKEGRNMLVFPDFKY